MPVVKAAVQKRLGLAGRFMPELHNFVVTRQEFYEIIDALRDTVDIIDIAFLLITSLCTVYVARIVHDIWFPKNEQDIASNDSRTDSGISEDKPPPDRFESSYTYHIAFNISQMARIAVIVYMIDCLMVVAHLQGFELSMTNQVDFGAKVARIMYTAWFANRCSQFKQYLLGRAVKKQPEKLGKIKVYDQILDVVIYLILAFSVMDTLDIEYGAGFKSLFAFGGIGTLVFSLASKDMATLFVSGLVLSTSERFRKDDFIKLGDNTSGTVVETGFLYTSIRGANEHIVKIPNTQLANQRLSNLSRMAKCQVEQTLRFHYSDLDKLPEITSKIKEEIEAKCPNLIKDGSRPFRVSLTQFCEDHFEVAVDTRHNLPPIGMKYWENREKVLAAIASAVAKLNVRFAIPERRILADEDR